MLCTYARDISSQPQNGKFLYELLPRMSPEMKEGAKNVVRDPTIDRNTYVFLLQLFKGADNN